MPNEVFMKLPKITDKQAGKLILYVRIVGSAVVAAAVLLRGQWGIGAAREIVPNLGG